MVRKETPDELLKRLKYEEALNNRGHLKIFFGYAAGVGKTYAMLAAAHELKKQDIDVVIGYIEPHTREKTMALMEGLEKIETLTINYHGMVLKEFDLDQALIRHPQVLLVDELAHTNAHGCRHEKRYQDIEELLKAGIDVYTTVNVQHLESLNDIIASITGIVVHERIPDRIFDQADQVELVDIEPEELTHRLSEGLIYKKQQADKALESFFNQANLTSLREIALRRAADRVNKLAEQTKHTSIGYTDEHILVCLSPSPSNPKIIRTASRMASAFKGKLSALFVETSGFVSMSNENRERLRSNIHLASQLGANIETAFGDDVAFQIAEFARNNKVSKIVLGRSNTRSHFGMLHRPFSEQLTAYAPNLDIYIIPDKDTPVYKRKPSFDKSELNFRNIAIAATALLMSTLIGFIFYEVGFSEANIITIYILGVLITSVVTANQIISALSAVLSVVVFNFFFTDPRYTLAAYDSGYPITFIIMFIAAVITGDLAIRIRKQARQSANTAFQTKILLETSQLLQNAKNAEDIIKCTANQLIKLLDIPIVFYQAKDYGLKEPELFSSEPLTFSENEKAVAQWVYENNKRAGKSTNTLGNAQCLYLAVRSDLQVHGVIGLALKDSLDTFASNLVLSIISECALALEKEMFNYKREEASVKARNEKLRADLLRSISHDFRTPLTSISGNASMLINNCDRLEVNKRYQLLMDIYDDSMWLINLTENLLSVTRIEDGTTHLNMQAEVVDEVLLEAIKHVNRHSIEHKLQVIPSDEVLLAKMDSHLIMQVLINLIDNAIKYTPAGSDIIVKCIKKGSMVEISVADNGEGIQDKDKSLLFDMFYTVKKSVADSRRGMRIGLSLCKSIIQAHGGTIMVSDNVPHGTIFTISLPSEEVDLHE